MCSSCLIFFSENDDFKVRYYITIFYHKYAKHEVINWIILPISKKKKKNIYKHEHSYLSIYHGASNMIHVANKTGGRYSWMFISYALGPRHNIIIIGIYQHCR